MGMLVIVSRIKDQGDRKEGYVMQPKVRRCTTTGCKTRSEDGSRGLEPKAVEGKEGR